MYTIDAYDLDAWQARQESRDSREDAIRTAQRFAQAWKVVEVRNPNEPNPENQPIAAWINGERQF